MDGRVGRRPIFPAAAAASRPITFEKNAVLLVDTVLRRPGVLSPGLRKNNFKNELIVLLFLPENFVAAILNKLNFNLLT